MESDLKYEKEFSIEELTLFCLFIGEDLSDIYIF